MELERKKEEEGRPKDPSQEAKRKWSKDQTSQKNGTEKEDMKKKTLSWIKSPLESKKTT